MTVNKSWIQQNIAGRTDIKLLGDTPAQHSARVIMGTCQNQPELTPCNEAPETVHWYQDNRD